MWTVEIAIPYAALATCNAGNSPPAPGDVWNVDFSREGRQHGGLDARYDWSFIESVVDDR